MLKSLEISGFKSFANKSTLEFDAPITAIVGPNGSGKSNAAEAFRFVLGEQSLKALRVNNTDELLFNGGQSGQRKHRAHVQAHLDNSDDKLDVDYDEVQIQRVIERGDASTYRLNGSQVRLKDVTVLLADANIGTSRHHIISQGESDRILNVNNRERKNIVEDALGLRRFYRRRREAERKLSKTQDNLADIQARLEDIKPEYDYLKRQKSRIKKTEKLREQLTEKYKQYFRRESLRIEDRKDTLHEKKEQLEETKQRRAQKITELKDRLANLEQAEDDDTEEKKPEHNKEASEQLKNELTKVRSQLSELSEKQGRIAGKIETLQQQKEPTTNKTKTVGMSRDTFVEHKNNLEDIIDRRHNDSSDITELWDVLTDHIEQLLQSLSTDNQDRKQQDDIEDRINQLKSDKSEIVAKREKLQNKKQNIQQKLEDFESRNTTTSKNDTKHKLEKDILKFRTKQETTQTKLDNLEEKIAQLSTREEQLEEEKAEAKVLCGEAVLAFEDTPITNPDGDHIDPETFLDQDQNRDFKRELERLKVKLEDTRVSDPDEVLSEFERVEERIEFFRREISDLKQTRDQLQDVITEINETVATKFDRGVQDINEVFSNFFATMFGGGSAELYITKHPEGRNVTIDDVDHQPESIEKGVGIRVQLPNKKVRGLDVLSGGERALTSIALLFSLSQINPPPFIVLDEADAALDEANSRRFGEMIEGLAEHSQLVVITHNRETMRRADLLYGVTMDNTGGSRLLSLDFSEAVDTIEQ